VISRRIHFHQNIIQPLEWTVQVDLHPTGGRCDILSVVIAAPTLDKGHPQGTHLSQLKYSFIAMSNTIAKLVSKLGAIEDAQGVGGWDLPDR
jgi:hypothetical protein